MAKLGEGDNRWIVRERDDGRNCNNWHWTSKDISGHMKKALADRLQAVVFPPPLSECAIKSCEVSGEASITNRKGRTFLMYELEVKLKWEAELRDADGACLESCKGSMKMADVNATMLDDLDVEFTCKSRDGKLVTSMRKQGVAHARKEVERIITDMQEEVRAEAAAAPAAASPMSSSTPAPPKPIPLPTPIAVEAASRPVGYASVAVVGSSVKAGVDSDEEEAEEAPPPPLAKALRALRDKPSQQKRVLLSNCAIKDCHLQRLIEALHHSECAVEELDLSFNRITDAGVHVLCKALSSGCAMELTKLYMGGNKNSVGGMALSQQLKQVRSDLLVDWKKQLRDAQSLCTVGNVYTGSPALKAGLLTSDSVVAFGTIQHRDFKSVTESIVPLVKSHVGKLIDVVVVRMGEGGQVQQVQLTLVPQKWSGGGLLGCILK